MTTTRAEVGTTSPGTMTTAPFPDPPGRPAADQTTAARVAELFERHGRMVYGVCRAMLRDTHDAEDATQQTFLSAHRALLRGARVRDAGAWLATIARNECRGRIAAGMRTPPPLADEDLDAIPAHHDEAERRLHAQALKTAIAELPDRQREAIVLRDLYGLRYGEVAKALGLSRPATEALLFRARRAMRVRLRPVVGTALAVPVAIRDDLAEAIPGFATPTGSGAVAVGAAGGLLAKLTAGPMGVKVVTAAVAVSAVGAVGSVESERAVRDQSPRLSLPAQSEDVSAVLGGASGSPTLGWGSATNDGPGDHGSRSQGISSENRTRHGSGDDGSSASEGGRSGSGESVAPAGDGGSGGTGETESSGDSGSGGGDSGSGTSGSSGSDDSAQPSGGGEDPSGSSGPGSGSVAPTGSDDSGSTSSGPSADDASSGSTGSGASGSGSSDSSGSGGSTGSSGSGSGSDAGTGSVGSSGGD